MLRSIARAMRLEGWRQRRCKRPSFETPAFGLLLRMRSESMDTISFKETLI